MIKQTKFIVQEKHFCENCGNEIDIGFDWRDQFGFSRHVPIPNICEKCEAESE